MAFIDKKNDDLQNDTELDPIDEILKRINEKRITLPGQDVEETEQDETNPKEPAKEESPKEEPAKEELNTEDTASEDSMPGEPVLDKKAEELSPSGEPDEESDEDEPEEKDNEEEASEEVEENCRCIRCGKRRRDESVSPDYEYCAKCREEMRNAPMSWKGIVCAFCIIIIAGMALLLGANSAVIALPVTEARDYEISHRLNDALDSYTDAQTSADGFNANYKNPFYVCGTKTFVKKMQVTAEASGPLAVGNTLSKAPVKNALNFKSPWQKTLKQYSDAFAVYNTTNTALEPILSEYQNSKASEIPYDKVISQLDALKTGKDAKKYALYIIEFYKASVAERAEKDPEVQLKFLLEVKKLAPKESWLYNAYLADCYQRMKKYDNEIATCNEMIAVNTNDLSAYSLKARALCSQKDFKAALAVCGEAEKNNTSSAALYALKTEVYRRSDNLKEAAAVCEEAIQKNLLSTELYRQQAIVYLLQGNKKAAYGAVYNAYNSAYTNQDITLPLMNTIALCASLAGEKDMYNETVKTLKQYDYELADSVTKCIKGTITPKEIFITGEGDVL